MKILLTPVEPMQQFVQSYILLLTDSSSETFTKILSAKGVTKSTDQKVYLDEFNLHVPPTPCGQSFLTSETMPKTSNWSESLISKLKDLGFYQLKSYSRTKDIREPKDGNVSPISCQSASGETTERGM